MPRLDDRKKPRPGSRVRGVRGKRDLAKKRIFKKKSCKFCMEKVEGISYFDFSRFQKSLTERGKIISSRISGNCAKHQRQLSRAIKRARIAALLPFVAE